MEKKNDESLITLRRCDLNGILMLLSLNNKSAIEASWMDLELMKLKSKKAKPVYCEQNNNKNNYFHI